MRSFFVLSDREKATPTTHPQKATKTTQIDKAGKRTSKAGKQAKKMKNRGKTIKIGANTQQAFNPPNHSRTQKPHKPRKAPRQHNHTQTPQTSLKTPLKREIEPYLQATHQRQSERADKRTGHTTRGPATNVWQVLKPQRACTPATSGHDKYSQAEPAKPAQSAPTFQKYV